MSKLSWQNGGGNLLEGLGLRAVDGVHTVKGWALQTKQFICTAVYTDRITVIGFFLLQIFNDPVQI